MTPAHTAHVVHCAWIACTAAAEHVQRDKYGVAWTNLCTAHDVELSNALQGAGAKALTRRMLGGR